MYNSCKTLLGKTVRGGEKWGKMQKGQVEGECDGQPLGRQSWRARGSEYTLLKPSELLPWDPVRAQGEP